MSAQKAFQGYEAEKRQRVVGMEELSVSSMRGHWFAYHTNQWTIWPPDIWMFAPPPVGDILWIGISRTRQKYKFFWAGILKTVDLIPFDPREWNMCSGKSAAYDKIERFSIRTRKTASAGKVKHGKYSSNSEINLKTETPFSRSAKCSTSPGKSSIENIEKTQFNPSSMVHS